MAQIISRTIRLISAKCCPFTGYTGMNVRPSARVHKFFKDHMAGTIKQEITLSRKVDRMTACAGITPDGKETIVVVNSALAGRMLKLKLDPFGRTMYEGLSLPTEYMYCDTASIRQGTGYFFDKDGQVQLYMPRYSAWLLTVHNPAKASAESAEKK